MPAKASHAMQGNPPRPGTAGKHHSGGVTFAVARCRRGRPRRVGLQSVQGQQHERQTNPLHADGLVSSEVTQLLADGAVPSRATSVRWRLCLPRPAMQGKARQPASARNCGRASLGRCNFRSGAVPTRATSPSWPPKASKGKQHERQTNPLHARRIPGNHHTGGENSGVRKLKPPQEGQR